MTFLRKFHKIILKEEAKVHKPPIKHYNILFCCQVPFCMRSRPIKKYPAPLASQIYLHKKYSVLLAGRNDPPRKYQILSC